MTNEVIEKITGAEAEAEAILAEARNTAAEILSAATTGQNEAIQNATVLGEEKFAATKKKAAEAVEKRLERATDEARSEAKNIVSAAEKKMDDAIDLIIREIFEKWQ